MTARFQTPNEQFSDDTGTPYAGGKLYFYLTGTTTATDTYTTEALSTANANPVVLDSAGRAGNIFLDPAITYKVVLKDSNDAQIWTADPVTDPAAGVTAAFAVVSGDPNGQTAGSAGSVGGTSASVRWDILNNLLYVCTTTGTTSTAVWTQVAADLSGALNATGIVTPSTIGSNQDNYEPAGLSTAYVARLAASTPGFSLTGMATGSAGRLLTIENVGSFPITLKDDADTTSTAANRFALPGGDVVVRAGGSVSLWYDGTSSRWRLNGPIPFLVGACPGGRLTLTTAVPVLTSDVTAAATIYYTPYISNIAMISDGTTLAATHFSELSQALSDSTKSPAAGATNSVYDMFVWNDAGTLRCTRGPAWSTATSRGTGAGTSELTTLHGVRVNANAISNGPVASAGVFVGTIATDGSTQCNMMLAPTAAAGGTANRLDVWNMYNRVDTPSICRDSTNTWAYTTATYRSANNSTSNRITLVRGLDEDTVFVSYHAAGLNSSTVLFAAGVGLDATDAVAQHEGLSGEAGLAAGTITGIYEGLPGIGRHFFQAIEWSTATGVTTWHGDNGATQRSILRGRFRM